jgi:geranylgeranyl pyrophosphate synthase
MAAYQELGGSGDVTELAAAVEVVHTYSLVHDDLPCMDDDDLRRGRPTTHNTFDVATATEAGFRMVPLAARVLAAGSERLGLDEKTTGRIGIELFGAAGAGGMVGGQWMDLENEGRSLSLEELTDMHRRKTGALIEACCVIGAVAAGAGARRVQALRRYGTEIGMAFQIFDDVLDATGSSAELGKTAGKDMKQNKATFVTVLGIHEAARAGRHRVQVAIDQLGAGGVDSVLLEELARFIVNRRS